MKKVTTTVLLLIALVFPVVLFWLLISHASVSILVAAAISIAVGWALNLAWAFAVGKTTTGGPPQADGDFFAIAARFGWICPSVLVFLTWLVWHFTTVNSA